MIRFLCEACGNTLQVPGMARGKRARCECGNIERVPQYTPRYLKPHPRVERDGDHWLLDCPNCHARLRTPNIDDDRRILCECGAIFKLPDARHGHLVTPPLQPAGLFEATEVAKHAKSTFDDAEERAAYAPGYPVEESQTAPPINTLPGQPVSQRQAKANTEAAKSVGTGCLMMAGAIVWLVISVFAFGNLPIYAILLLLFGIFTFFQGIFGVVNKPPA